jgi:hypothetical protein
MGYSYWIGILANFEFSLPEFLFFAVLYLIALISSVWIGHFKIKNKGFVTAVAVNLLSLALFGLVGIIFLGVVYFISFALLSDFRNDYN